MDNIGSAYELILWIYTNCGHFDTVIFALPVILLVTLLYWTFRLIWHKRKFGGEFRTVRKTSRLNEVIRLLTVCWTTALICITCTPTEALKDCWLYIVTGENPIYVFLPQLYGLEPRGFGDIVLMPQILRYILNGHLDWLWRSAKSISPQLLLNVVLFVPLGLAMPFICKKSSLLKASLTGLSISFIVEFVQFFIGRSCETDDLICNTLGAVVGYLLYLLIKKRFPKLVENGKKTAKEVFKTFHAEHETVGETAI